MSDLNNNPALFFETSTTATAPADVADLFNQGVLGGIDNEMAEECGADVRKLVLGSVCWWSVNNADVSYSRFKLEMMDAGVPQNWIHPQHNYRDALMAALRGLHSASEWPIEVKKITLGTQDGRSPAVHALMHTIVDATNKRVTVKQIATTTFNNTSGSLEMDWDMSTFDDIAFSPVDLEQQLKTDIAHHVTNFSSKDIRDNVLDIVTHQLDGFRVRPTGGIYFVPAKFGQVLDALDKVIRSVSGQNTITGEKDSGLFQLDVLDSAKAKTTLMVSYGQFLEAEIKRLSEGLTVAESGKRNIRSGTLQERLVELNKLKGRAQRFATMFDMQVDRLNDALNTTGRRIVTLIKE